MPLKLYRRKNIWNYRGTVAGRRLRGSCKTTEKDIASRQIAEIEREQWRGSIDGPAAVLTFAKAAMLYRAGGKSPRYLEPVANYFKDTLVKDITPAAIIEMCMKLYSHTKGSSRNRLGIIPAQAVINYAAESGLCSRIRIKRFKSESKVKEPATLEWIEEFCGHAKPHLGTYARFMFLTGARPGEAIDLQWKDIDFPAKTALIRQTKTHEERVAHLPQPLIVALANLKRVNGRGVFVYGHPDDAAKTWVALTARHGMKPLTPHCCRHGFATGLLRRGIDVITVAKLGGWKGPKQVLSTYGHAVDDRTLTDILLNAAPREKAAND